MARESSDDIPLKWLDKWISPRLQAARKAIDAVPMRQETWEQWRAAFKAVADCQISVDELRRLASWIRHTADDPVPEKPSMRKRKGGKVEEKVKISIELPPHVVTAALAMVVEMIEERSAGREESELPRGRRGVNIPT